MKPPKISIKVSIYQYQLQYWPIVGLKWYRYLSAWELDCLLIYWYRFFLNLKHRTGFRNSTSPSTSSYHALVRRSNHGPDMSTPRSRQSPSSHYHRLMAASSDTGSDFGSCESLSCLGALTQSAPVSWASLQDVSITGVIGFILSKVLIYDATYKIHSHFIYLLGQGPVTFQSFVAKTFTKCLSCSTIFRLVIVGHSNRLDIVDCSTFNPNRWHWSE